MTDPLIPDSTGARIRMAETVRLFRITCGALK
jgi:hypothetical protein